MLHPLVKRTQEGFQNRDSDSDGRMIPSGTGCLYISVSKEMIPKALRAMDAIVKDFERRGWKVETKDEGNGFYLWPKATQVTIEGTNLEFRLIEPVLRSDNKAYNPQKGWSRDRYIYTCSGKLQFSIESFAEGGQHRWTGREKLPLEQQLDSIAQGMLAAAHHQIEINARWERERKAREEQQRAEEKAEARHKAEQARVDDLMEKVGRWEACERIGRFLEALKKRVEVLPGGSTEEMKAWIEWAEECARVNDPVEEMVRGWTEEKKERVIGDGIIPRAT